MINEMKSYSAYKDSGVPWLGKVPEHWDVLPNRAIFKEVKERDRPEEPMLSVTITKGVILQQALLADSSKKDSSNQDKSAYKLVKVGDIVYNKMRAWQGAVGVSNYQGIVSPAYVVQCPRERANSRYLHYLLRTPAFAKEAERWSYGISESATDSGTIRLLKMGNIKNGEVYIPELGGVSSVNDSLLLKAGDLLFNRTNSSALVGKVGLFRGAESATTFASYLVRMRPRQKHEPEYLNIVLNDILIFSIARREAIPSLHQSNLNPTRYGRLQISLPPLEEQRKILQFAKKQFFYFDSIIAASQQEISLLREYRSSLIADVVTGKIDVREAAAHLPDEPEEEKPSVEPDALEEIDKEVTDDLYAVSEEEES